MVSILRIRLNLFFILLFSSSITSHKHSSHPLMLLVSFDGFRWDYLSRTGLNLSNFNELKRLGSHADYIYNSFATVTFPNHWTLATGMYEENHGLVHNEMYDPTFNETFKSGITKLTDKKWYGQNKLTEPIWITNQKAGGNRKSASNWIGSGLEFNNQMALEIPYDDKKPYEKIIDDFINLFTRSDDSINFGAMYFDEPDATGHLYGPNSKEMDQKLISLDKTLGYLIEQLKSHHLFDKLNLIITSDHGMEEVSESRVVYLDSLVNLNLFKAYGRRTSFNLFLEKKDDLDEVFKKISTSNDLIVYKKDHVPDSLHYKNNVRIGDLVVIAKIGYQIMLTKDSRFDWSKHRGDHGYMNNESSMYPLFIAHGPAFKSNYKIKSFYNVDIYPLMCLLLGVQPANSDGDLKNVIEMVNYHAIEVSFSWIYFLILLIPFSLVLITFLVLCAFRLKNDRRATDSTMYTEVNQHELLIRDGNLELNDE